MSATSLAAVSVLWRRDLIHFTRQRGRVIAAISQPLLLWVFLGAGFGGGMKVGSLSYLEFFFPGMVLLVVLFATIFSTISVIEDRQQGFLRAVLASPSSRASIILGKALGSATLGCLQGSVLLLLAPAAGIPFHPLNFLASVLVLFVLAYSLSALGLTLAWSSQTTASFHASMNFILLPMWLLSGTLFPVAGAPFWLEWAIRINPLTYGLQALRHTLYPAGQAPAVGVSAPMELTWVVCGIFLLAMHLLALSVARRGGSQT